MLDIFNENYHHFKDNYSSFDDFSESPAGEIIFQNNVVRKPRRN